MKNNYIVATIRPWNIAIFNEVIKKYPGNWYLIQNPNKLTADYISTINPKYIFFPHWSKIVPEQILNLSECVCFHETDLPFGKGGSPIQNLISRGYKNTMISALRMTNEVDSGPIYLKKKLVLEGIAEDIYLRAAKIVAKMIKIIIDENITPQRQTGKSGFFKRRNPSESEIPISIKSVSKIYDHIRMLDAPEYPKAFLNFGEFKYEISAPQKKGNRIIAKIEIKKIGN